MTTDPLMTDPANAIFTLTASSPARDSGSPGVAVNAYDAYFAEYGINIQYDINGLALPDNGTFDRGANEYNSANPPDPPAATPTYDPLPGTYPTAQDVAISTATVTATIFYTTDGSIPDANSTP